MFGSWRPEKNLDKYPENNEENVLLCDCHKSFRALIDCVAEHIDGSPIGTEDYRRLQTVHLKNLDALHAYWQEQEDAGLSKHHEGKITTKTSAFNEVPDSVHD